MAFIEWPYVYAKGVHTSFESSGPVQELLSFLKSSLTIGLVISGPFVFYGSWKYLFDILHKKDILTKFWAIFSGASFSIGALFYIFVVAPFHFRSVFQVEKEIPIGGAEINMALDPYVSFITAGMLITGLLFHSPMILSLLKLKREINRDNGAVKQ
jgi:sec-independent protein translocase protein TatC